MIEIVVMAQAAKDIGIGAGSVTLLGIIALLIKRGVSGNFRIGGESKSLADREEGRDQNLSDNGKDQIERHLARADQDSEYSRELCRTLHAQIDKDMVSTETRIDKLDEKIDVGFTRVYDKLDRITEHLMGDDNGPAAKD